MACPPDGLCILYAWLASQEPEAWQNVAKDGMGFIVDPSEEQVWKAKALSLSDQILALMDVDGRRARVVRCRVVLVLKDLESRRCAIGFKVSVM